jgi:methylmalonyl-CoA mutase
MTSDKEQPLFSEFPPVSAEEWEHRIWENVEGDDYDRKMTWRPLDGLEVRPFYKQKDLEGLEFLESVPGYFPFVRGGKTKDNSWGIVEDIRVTGLDQGNSDARKALEKGATALAFHFSKLIPKHVDQLAVLVSGIDLESVAVDLFTDKDHLALLQALGDLVAIDQSDVEKIRGSVNVSPLGHIFTTGHIGTHLDYHKLFEILKYSSENLPRFKVLRIHGTVFHNAGASILQQIAYSLATAVEYLSSLAEVGFGVKASAGRMAFQFSIGPNYFLEIASLRAARLLWANILEAYGLKDHPACSMYIHAVTSEWNQTLYDPYVNMLRGTTETMSAILGGADSVSVTPFDHAFNTNGEFSKRHARNTQIILKEEAWLDKVADPAAGSYYIENLTAMIAENAWAIFLEAEAAGGILEMFKKGDLHKAIRDMAAKKYARVASRQDKMVGTNRYPNAREKSRLKLYPEHKAEVAVYPPLSKSRVSVEMEEIRLKTEKSGKIPGVFLLTYGDPDMRRARATFATNFFACAGFEIIDNPGFLSLSEGLSKALEAKAEIIVLCSTDDEYIKMAKATMLVVRDQAVVVIAGYPGEQLEEIRKAGVEHFIHLLSNLLEELRKFQDLVLK